MNTYERIKELRKNILKLTQDDFASKINMSRSNLGSIEIGRINVTDRVIKDICKEYNVNESWLRNGEGDIFNKEKENKISELLNQYDLGIYGKKILEIYLSLDISQKKVINDFLKKFVNEFQSEQQESQEN